MRKLTLWCGPLAAPASIGAALDSERLKFQLRADSFNFFNHTNFTGLSTSLNSPTFGRFTSTRGARVAQLSARLRF